jgi:rRNA maturation protein Rpf1
MRPKKITFFDANEGIQLECKFSSLPLKDEKIIEKSVELFNDHEPCVIHKSFAMKKLLFEIDEYFSEVLPSGKGQIIWESIPQNIRELLHINDEVVKVQLDM